MWKGRVVRESLMRRLVIKMLMFGTGLIVISFVQMGKGGILSEPWMLNQNECPLNFGLNHNFNLSHLFGVLRVGCKWNEILAKNVFEELMENRFVDSNMKALYVGDGADAAVLALRELGFSDVSGVNRNPFLSLLKRRFVYELDFEDNCFEPFSSLVLEIENALSPGGVGVMILGAKGLYSGNLVWSAIPIPSFLKSSDVVHLCAVGSFTLVLFRKRAENVALFEQFKLPEYCPSVTNNKPFMPHIESLANKHPLEHEQKISYLPNFVNISSRNKLVYINVGAGELVDKTITKTFNAHYPIPHQALDVYVIDHNASALSLYVKTPGITFVYHPRLAGEEMTAQSTYVADDYLGDDKDFDFAIWFNETVNDRDFVVLMMNAQAAELQILDDLFSTGLICGVDELFLRCSDSPASKSARYGDCMSLFKSLRNSGIYGHWLRD